MSTKEEERSKSNAEKTEKKQAKKRQKQVIRLKKTSITRHRETVNLKEKESPVLIEKEEEIFPEFRELVYMYTVPRNREMKKAWAKDWSDFVFKWAQFHKRLVISISDIRNSPAFRYTDSRLTVVAIREIFEFMVEKGLASWWGSEKHRIRIHWKSDEELLEDIYSWAWNSGKLILDVYQLISAEKFWSSLPPEFLYTLLEELVKRKRAHWYNKKKTIVEIKLRDFKQE